MQFYLFVFNHWLHVISAVAALGGTMFLRFVVHPGLKALKEDSRGEFERTIRRKATMFVLHPLIVLIITGLVNVVRVMKEVQKPYHMLLGIKILLVLALFSIALGLMVPSDAFAKLQANRPKWLLVNFILGAIIVFLSAWMRMIPRVGG